MRLLVLLGNRAIPLSRMDCARPPQHAGVGLDCGEHDLQLFHLRVHQTWIPGPNQCGDHGTFFFPF